MHFKNSSVFRLPFFRIFFAVLLLVFHFSRRYGLDIDGTIMQTLIPECGRIGSIIEHHFPVIGQECVVICFVARPGQETFLCLTRTVETGRGVKRTDSRLLKAVMAFGWIVIVPGFQVIVVRTNNITKQRRLV